MWGTEPPAESAPSAAEAGAPPPVPDWELPPPPAAHVEGTADASEALDPPVPPPSSEAAQEPAEEPAPEPSVAMQDFSMPPPAAEEADPDESHWRETYDQFCELKVQLGEPADRLTFEKFAAKLRKNRTELVAKHNCKSVRFSVYEKDGKAAIKASAIR